MKKTKIIATIGPASIEVNVLSKLIKAGVNVMRVNASHGGHSQHQEIIDNIRAAENKTGQTVGILYDLQGPKIRIGDLGPEHKKGVAVKKGETVYLHTGDEYYVEKDAKYFPVQFKPLVKEVQAKETILINDGLMELKVIKHNLRKTAVACEVITDGLIGSNKGINVPQTALKANALTEKDLEDLKFAAQTKVDFIALSFVRTAEDIQYLKAKCEELKFYPNIVAKIERPEAIDNLEEITIKTDSIMVARGDLGIEIPAAKVPLVQRKIIETANRHAKPVIIATQVFSSMIENPRPTRAEISDAANSVFDYTDAIMLSNETAVGNYPIETVETLSEVIKTIEHELAKDEDLLKVKNSKNTPINAITENAVELAQDLEAKLLVAVTNSGHTARSIAKFRTYVPLVVYTNSERIRRQLTLCWGINTVFTKTDIDPTNPTPFLRTALLEHKLAGKGDEIVVCNAGQNNRERLITTFKL
jgi:pyruvate kinase